MKGSSLPMIQEVSGVCSAPFLDTDDLEMALRARKLSGAFEKRAPDRDTSILFIKVNRSKNICCLLDLALRMRALNLCGLVMVFFPLNK